MMAKFTPTMMRIIVITRIKKVSENDDDNKMMLMIIYNYDDDNSNDRHKGIKLLMRLDFYMKTKILTYTLISFD